MRFRERRRSDGAGGDGDASPAPGDGNLDHLRQAGLAFLRQGDEAINNVISRGSSEAFLSAIRQQGGE